MPPAPLHRCCSSSRLQIIDLPSFSDPHLGMAPGKSGIVLPVKAFAFVALFPLGFHSPSLHRTSRKDSLSLPGDFVSLARAVEATTYQSPGWHPSFLSAQMKSVFLLPYVRGRMVKPFALTLSFHFCSRVVDQQPRTSQLLPSTLLHQSYLHHRSPERKAEDVKHPRQGHFNERRDQSKT